MTPASARPSLQTAPPGSQPLRVVSYNIRKAVGTDRRRDPDRVLRVLAEVGADIALLQEADLRLPPRRPVLDPVAIKAATGMAPVHFAKGVAMGWHGNALLLAPHIKLQALALHDLPGLEPRGCLVAEVQRGDQHLRVVGVHLGLLRGSRRQQLTALLRHLGQDPLPTLIAGDFNERSLEVGLGRLSRQFTILSGGPTYHSRWPVFALDRMAVSEGIQPLNIIAHRSADADTASDHLPLVGDFTLSAAQTRSAGGAP
ncbi:endonuclease/exonuclease/phosphatase family protein [Xinfangfangia sp. CPCC 101601]|uniref:Endonuclease/exonuclease/phosphatase family protein n=1 Tax=Pseudogemmobacter lacusdianii TaxID=3069608 RepID=A0ABU0VWJ7_9RHOB|nr:endonuclease/exonuclease/phosphatase family protein [Xinfangfangia sp. CPCC 101601]MDQ2066110.1 endonuclease/exonuclease/phosphatase family protein [Xinfangfangia sp. CPCC 101601]